VNYTNYDSVLGQLRDAGLLVDELDIGVRRRCRIADDRERRGWYHLHELRTDRGDLLIVGSYGVWRGNDPGTLKVEISKATPLNAEQREALKARIAEDRKAEAARRKAEAERASNRATAMWKRLAETGDSEYLQRKGVIAHGVRFGPSGSVIVPMLDVAGRIWGLQAIYPKAHPKRARTGRDKDFWPAGLAKQGHFHLIGSPMVGVCCLVAEGYATGASLHEATGLPVAVAFDAGNLVHVAQALRGRYRGLRVLVCADDDHVGKCRECGAYTPVVESACRACGKEHRCTNAGIVGAEAAALAASGAWLAPVFAEARATDAKGPTDFNDLHLADGLHAVRAQVEARLTALQWRSKPAPATAHQGGGEAAAADDALQCVVHVGQLHERFALVYEAADTVFDLVEHKLVPLASMRNLCAGRQIHRQWMDSADKRVVRLSEVGFDPTGRDETVKCNLWSGWPTRPKQGSCERILELGEYLCSQDARAGEMWLWLLRWLAYPIQHPGAKMKTAVVMHGPQGTGKNLFFETIVRIYGSYGRVVGQDAIEDKFNDWASKKLFIVADEVVARDDLYHSKNRLKGLVTGDRIRINPKNVASYEEANHCNLAFLSNETVPMALERDDRRYAVIWTPPKWDTARYHSVLAELSAGGVAALHHQLLSLDLADFGPATLPPMTEAKSDLIELGMDSSERFWVEWTAGRLEALPVTAVRSEDLYRAYRHWASLQGVHKCAQLSTCMGTWTKRPGVQKRRDRHLENYSKTKVVMSTVVYPPGAARDGGIAALADLINAFNTALRTWTENTSTTGSARSGRGQKAANGDTSGGEDDGF
jgi:putative DNA primase/helicase